MMPKIITASQSALLVSYYVHNSNQSTYKFIEKSTKIPSQEKCRSDECIRFLDDDIVQKIGNGQILKPIANEKWQLGMIAINVLFEMGSDNLLALIFIIFNKYGFFKAILVVQFQNSNTMILVGGGIWNVKQCVRVIGLYAKIEIEVPKLIICCELLNDGQMNDCLFLFFNRI